MKKSWLIAALIGVPPVFAFADDGQIGSAEVFELMQAADGAVTVLIAGDADSALAGALIQMLADSAVKDLRVGISDQVADRDAIFASFESNFEAGSDLRVCGDWLTANGNQQRVSDFIVDEFGGSLVVIDNGENDRDRFGPALGEDPWSGADENPILFGIFGSETPWGKVLTATQYRAAWQSVDGLTLGLDVNGC